MFEGPSGIEAGEQEEVVNEMTHAVGFGTDSRQRFGYRRGQVAADALGVFGLAAHDRNRGSQLVTGVSDEVTEVIFARVAVTQCRFDVFEHVVERVGYLSGFSLRCVHGDSLRQRHRAR